jgi:hypothetical protein
VLTLSNYSQAPKQQEPFNGIGFDRLGNYELHCSAVNSMKAEQKPTQYINGALHGCPLLCTKLGVRGLACLTASSSSLKEACSSIIQSQPHEWIQLAVNSAQGAQLQWVLKEAPAAAAGAAERLVRMPAVPLDMAELLVAAGVRVSYAQLIAAANSMVAGVEVWVHAQQRLGVDSEIPSVAKAICNSSSFDIRANLVSCYHASLLSPVDQPQAA